MRALILTSILFLIVINTSYFWRYALGLLEIFAHLILLGVFIFFILMLALHFIKAIKEKFLVRRRNILLFCLTIVIGLTLYKPFGLIDFKKFEGEDLMIAEREGTANCMTRLHLKEVGLFIEESFCFGLSRIRGTYEIENDTIWFSNNYEYKFGIICTLNSSKRIELYKHSKDKKPLWLIITTQKEDYLNEPYGNPLKRRAIYCC